MKYFLRKILRSKLLRSKDGAPRWHYFYYLLAGLDLLTVILSLALTHNLMTIHETAVVESQQWANKVAKLNGIGALAQRVNSPGNNVFDSRDPVSERAKSEAAVVQFDAEIDRLKEEFQAAGLMSFNHEIAGISRAMGRMNDQADFIFDAFAAGAPALAGQRMAAMDRTYAEVTIAIATAVGAAQREQQAHLQTQVQAAREMRKMEYLILGLVVLMIAGVVVYGHRIGRVINSNHLDTVARRVAEEHLAEQMRLRAVADEANQAKSTFLANMSHELRTPLNAIIGYSEMVIEDLEADVADHPSKPDMDRVVNSARHLLSLINQILYLSKVEAGHVEVHREQIDLDGLLNEVIGIAKPLAKKSGIPLVLVPSDTGTIHADGQKVRQCLLNLLSNACKFTSQGSVQLSAERVTSEGRDTIRFCVTDTGIGMTQEQVGKIFRPFQQADSSIEQRFGGTGLGLAITREMAKLMGGDVTVESTAGIGTRVTMTIDADIKMPDQYESEIEPMVGDPDQPFVLVIEDEADARDLVTRALTPVGFSVQCATTARAGHKALTTRIPALIVLDICLPDASGWAFLDQIKRDKSLGNIPVVVLSTDDDRARSIALGAAEHIVKPVTRDALAATVVRLARSPIGDASGENRQAA